MQQAMLTKKTTRPPPTTAVYWLLASGENGRAEMLTIGRGGEEMLPVFSFEEEAGMFLSLRMPGERRSLKRTTARELVSILIGPCAGVDFVALDPLPEIVCLGMADLAGPSRERFMCRLSRKHRRSYAGGIKEPHLRCRAPGSWTSLLSSSLHIPSLTNRSQPASFETR